MKKLFAKDDNYELDKIERTQILQVLNVINRIFDNVFRLNFLKTKLPKVARAFLSSEIVNLCKGKVQDQEKTKIFGEIERLRTSLIHDNSSESAADKFKINI